MKHFLAFIGILIAAVSIGTAQSFTFVQPKEFFLFRPDVQKEVGFTEVQVSKIKAIAGHAISFTPEGRLQMRITSDSKTPTDIAAETAKVADAKQTKRLEEIWLQKTGIFALSNDEVAKQLKLSSAQKDKVDSILKEYGEELRHTMMSNGGRLDMSKMESVKSVFAKRIDAVLNAKQRQDFETMKGKPFKFSDPKKPSLTSS